MNDTYYFMDWLADELRACLNEYKELKISRINIQLTNNIIFSRVDVWLGGYVVADLTLDSGVLYLYFCNFNRDRGVKWEITNPDFNAVVVCDNVLSRLIEFGLMERKHE